MTLGSVKGGASGCASLLVWTDGAAHPLPSRALFQIFGHIALLRSRPGITDQGLAAAAGCG